MSKYRQAARVDDNQPSIVEHLRKLSGVTVEPGHDDILVGYKGQNYWIEIKDPAKTLNKCGRVKAKEIKKKQRELLSSWAGNYYIAWTFKEIVEIIGWNK